ncbi:D-amino-acid dehydrogenase [Variovorax paradoxus]|uniref:D-amino-acid dehydrogenase n=1 Tax=Variovorax paradoxus TaxID=34073 RepID=A0AAE3XXH5_VARPD|nr:FAD-dependent oxidoreductase [Variovorax paradoxus]MDR6427393.1 D-amino-acid dehydrogenase [Variovorax paradoxus]MDR6454555.1 D-amino-acid dehydrogenase [Variovorax paradoxus]
MKNTVAVLGAGIVGVSCALELQRRGFDVTVFDRAAPGRETSYGNAGVIARSSLMPFNHPGLWSSLPRLLKNNAAGFRYNPLFLAKNLPWALKFLSNTRAAVFHETTAALDALIRLSTAQHLRLLGEAGAAHRLRTNGWLFLYRSEEGFLGSQLSRDTFKKFGIATQLLDAQELAQLEPHLKPLFPRALWIQDTASVDSPGQVVEAYARLFVARGGRIRQASIGGLRRSEAGDAWQLSEDGGTLHEASRIVLALGPWTREFAKKALGLSVPMAYERGYHMHYRAAGGAMLGRPVYDTGGGYVLSPMEQGLRLSTGVQLADREAPKNLAQLDLAERAAREAFPLEARLDKEAWLGSRPTLPDSRPVIGECPGRPGLWLAFGHQHIGFNTAPGTAALLGAMMAGEACAFDPAPFRPSRFLG